MSLTFQNLEPGTPIIPVQVDFGGETWEGVALQEITFVTEKGYDALVEGARPKHLEDDEYLPGPPMNLMNTLHALATWDRQQGKHIDPCWQSLRTWMHILLTNTVPNPDHL